jgi:hypothetical protein
MSTRETSSIIDPKDIANRLEVAASIGWNEPEPYRAELTQLAAETLRKQASVVDAARRLRVSHTTTCDDRPVCICGLNNLRDAIAAYDRSK